MRSKEEIQRLLRWMQEALEDPALQETPTVAACVGLLEWILGQSSPFLEECVERCEEIDAQEEKATKAILN